MRDAMSLAIEPTARSSAIGWFNQSNAKEAEVEARARPSRISVALHSTMTDTAPGVLRQTMLIRAWACFRTCR